MSSFESLGLSADLVEALAAEGMEIPTPIQAAAIPVIRRGGSVVLEAGPGAGALLAYGVALLDRIEEPGRQCVLVATSDDREADLSALALARVAEVRGLSVSALGGVWSTPLDASIVFGSAERLADLLRLSVLDLEGVQALVVEGTHEIEASDDLEHVTLLAEALPGVQKVFVGLPVSEAVDALVRRTADKPVHLPPRAVEGTGTGAPAPGEALQFRVVTGDRARRLLEIVHERLDKAKRPHVTVHFRSDDQAADVGDELALHGFSVGEPGDAESRVWLCPPGTEAPQVSSAPVTAISYEPPVSVEALRAAHGGFSDSIVLVTRRELPHLRAVAAEAGFEARPLPVAPSEGTASQLRALTKRLERRVEAGGLLPYALLAERLGEERDLLEVASAALALALEAQPAAVAAGAEVSSRVLPQATPSWVKLFFSIGSRDEVGPGDLLGAITGETGISGSMVGRIEIHDSHTLVDVDAAQAERIMKAVNGTTIRGRSVRVDYHRQGGGRKGPPRPGGRSPRSGGPGRGRPGGPSDRGGRPSPRPRDR